MKFLKSITRIVYGLDGGIDKVYDFIADGVMRGKSGGWRTAFAKVPQVL
jgi:hypothetical protein